MDPQTLRHQLSGVIAFPITPFHKDLSLDLDGLKNNLTALLRHPLCAIVAAGGTGELYSLSPSEHLEVIRATVAAANRKVPVIAGVGFNHALATEMARQAATAGASGILAFPPYYPQPDWEGLHAYYKAISCASPLGMIIYSRDWAAFTPAQVQDLARLPNLIAWKDGQGDIRRFELIQHAVGDRLLWIGGAGDDLVPGYYSIGIRTFTSSIANVAPKLSLLLHQTAAAGNAPELAALMKKYVLPLYAVRALRKGYEVSAMKSMMELIGLAGGPVRPPLVNLSPADCKQISALLEVWQPVL